jgi:AbrB family looped-hinge helix DNA binding protein
MSSVTTSTLTSEGQITIPQEILEELGLKPSDKVEIVVDGAGGARLRKAGPSLEDVIGIFPALNVPEDEIERLTEAALAEHYAEKYR